MKTDFSDATVVYNGLTEMDDNELNLYRRLFEEKRVKIIKGLIPLISYRPVRIKVCKNIRFFLMKTPLENYRISDPDKWARYVLPENTNATMKNVYDYYYDLLKYLGNTGKELSEFIDDIRTLVRNSFK
jgi:hypothetical protein